MKRAFSLLELLVCIAIISILMAFLLPSLSKSRKSHNLIYCHNNLKNIATAINMYLYTYKVIPFAQKDMDASQQRFQLFECLKDDFTQTKPTLEKRVQPWVCPVDNEKFPLTGSSYRYVGGAYLQNDDYLVEPNPEALEIVTRKYLNDPNTPIITDYSWWHERKSIPGGGIRYDTNLDGYVKKVTILYNNGQYNTEN